MKGRIIPYIKLCVGLLFLFFVFRFAGRQHLFERVRQIDMGVAGIAILWSLLMISASCMKWYVLLRLEGYRESFPALLRIYFIGYFFTNILPSNVGGDVVRSYHAGKRIGSQSDAAVTVFMERFTGVIFLLLLVIGAPCLKPGLYGSLKFVVPAAGAAVMLIVFIVLYIMNRPLCASDSKGVVGLLERFRTKLAQSVKYLSGKPGYIFMVIMLTMVFYVMTWVNVYLAFAVFDVDVPFVSIAAVIPTAMLIAMAPVSLGSLGLAEGVYVFYSVSMGVSPADAAVMGLFLRLKIILLGCVGLVFYLAHKEKLKDDV